jgi:hypothetical protein
MAIPAETIEQQLANIQSEEHDSNLDDQYANPAFVEAKRTENIENSPYGKWYISTSAEKEWNIEEFQTRYSADIFKIFGEEISTQMQEAYEKSGNIESALVLVVSEIDLPDGDKEKLIDKVQEYLDPRLTSIRIDEKLRSEHWITVQSWMNTSYIPALSWSNRSFTLNNSANNLNIWDNLSYWGDGTSLMKNETQIGKLDEPDEGIPEIIWNEFNESRYAPIIRTHQDISSDPLKNISGEQVEQIWEEYAKWTDIVKAMSGVLDPAHEALSQAQNLDNPDKIDERRSQMYQDLGVENESRVDPSTWKGGNTITNLISENYTRITGSDWEIDTQASIILATQVSANKIIEGKHTFTRSKEFNQAYDRIQAWSNSPEELQNDLLLIHTTVNDAEGIKGRNRQSESQKIRKKAEQKSLFLSAEFLEIQALFIKAQESWNKDWIEKQKVAAEEWEKTKVASWEVMSWWELDLMAQLDEAWWESA